MVDRLAREHPEDLEVARSYLLVCNGELEETLEAAIGDVRLRIGVLGKHELAAAAASTLDRHAAAELADIDSPQRRLAVAFVHEVESDLSAASSVYVCGRSRRSRR